MNKMAEILSEVRNEFIQHRPIEETRGVNEIAPRVIRFD